MDSGRALYEHCANATVSVRFLRSGRSCNQQLTGSTSTRFFVVRIHAGEPAGSFVENKSGSPHLGSLLPSLVSEQPGLFWDYRYQPTIASRTRNLLISGRQKYTPNGSNGSRMVRSGFRLTKTPPREGGFHGFNSCIMLRHRQSGRNPRNILASFHRRDVSIRVLSP